MRTQGVDIVYADVSWTLGRNLENLTLTGTADIDATGNGLANVLTGNDGSNWLDGKGGADTMAGGRGDDTYVVAQSADVVIENIDQGIDTVMASVGYTLGREPGEPDPHRCEGDQRYRQRPGQRAHRQRRQQQAYRRGRRRSPRGSVGYRHPRRRGPGNDTYLLGLGYGTDTIVENDATLGNSDSATFLGGVANDQIWLRRVGNHLEASIIGTSDAFVLRDWYRGAAHRVERFQTTDGDKTLLESNVQALVDAMAAFAPPAPGYDDPARSTTRLPSTR